MGTEKGGVWKKRGKEEEWQSNIRRKGRQKERRRVFTLKKIKEKGKGGKSGRKSRKGRNKERETR